jgi:hypothetical protein
MSTITMNNVMHDPNRELDWRAISPKNLKLVRTMLIAKHGSLTQAASSFEMPFFRLSAAISGREQLIWVIETIQNDLELSDNQVLNLWPLLKVWPRESRRVE